MTRVFVGGSRRVSRLNADVRERLDRIIEKRLAVLVGDANGADKAVQTHLSNRTYKHVEVFCSGTHCRNNIGGWPERHIDVSNNRKRDFAFYSTKDRAMTDAASLGLMIWDGASVGTLLNVFRLLEKGKKVVLYAAHQRKFAELKTLADWDKFSICLDTDMRAQVERRAAEEKERASESQRPLPIEARALFEALRREVEQLHAYIVLYEQLYTTAASVEVLRRHAAAAFGNIQRALATAIELAICRLTDEASSVGRQNLSLARLAETLPTDEHSNLADELRAETVRLREKLEPTIRLLRNKVRAHNDYESKLGMRKDPLPTLDWATVREAARQIAELMNRAQPVVLGDDSTTGYDLTVLAGDGNDLLNALRRAGEHYDRLRKQREAL